MNQVEEWFLRVPPITRAYLSLIALTSIGCQLDLFNKFQLFFNWSLFWGQGQYWRLITTYLYMGKLSIDTAFHLYFLLQYCQTLEEDSFRGKRAEFLWFIVFSVFALTTLAVLTSLTSEIPFLSSSLTFTLTYLWSRRNPHLRMGFLGLITFDAPYLPCVLIGFSLLIHNVIPWADFLGFIVGHFYYFFEDVYPTLPGSRGIRPLATPDWFKNLVNFNERRRRRMEEEAVLNNARPPEDLLILDPNNGVIPDALDVLQMENIDGEENALLGRPDR